MNAPQALRRRNKFKGLLQAWQRANFRFATGLVLLLSCTVLLSGRDGHTDAPDLRDSRYFKLDKQHRVLGPAGHLPPVLALQLISVTMDQPQYWPDEVLRLRVVAPGRPSQKLAVQWSKRDATPHKASVELDEGGLAVLELANGKIERLELGEYRVEVRSDDGKLSSAATFAVVEGTLGEVSLAYPFQRVTSTEELDKAKGGWYLGNASGAGQRWGNGLSFKNQLRVDNEPYEGEVQLVPRCMLSGCNGVVAGPRQKVNVKGGLLAATLQVGGHSGPFQVEIVTPQGSLRHQFEGSSHVEREMIPVSKGMRWTHQISLAPYTGTAQVPGRSLFAGKLPQPQDDDAFELDTLYAADGKASVTARLSLKHVAALAWTAKADGAFAATSVTTPAELAAGQKISAAVSGPVALLAVGGIAQSGPHKGEWVEAYAMVFGPVGVLGHVEVPATARPNDTVAVTVELRDAQGKPLAGSAILEAYDNRVAAKDPANPLASAVGDSLRRAGRHLDEWVDPMEIERQRLAEEKARIKEEKRQREEERRERLRWQKMSKRERDLEKKAIAGAFKGGSSSNMYADEDSASGEVVAKSFGGAAEKKEAAVSIRMSGRMNAPQRPGKNGSASDDDDGDSGEKMREGQIKVTYVAVVRTDATGKVTVQVPTPPQTGRLALRLTAVRGQDWHTAEGQVDIERVASVEARVPKALLSGGELELRVVTHNKGTQPLTLRLQGAGFANEVVRPVGSGVQTHLLAWPALAGELQMSLVDAQGKVADKRLFRIQDLAKQAVTWSRLELGGARAVPVRQGDRLIAYAGPGAFMGGIVSNVVTTMESWFPHAEALSAKIAVQAIVLASVQQGLMRNDGYTQVMRGNLEHSVAQLEALYDASSQLIKPFAGLAGNVRWSAWVAANLHIARRGWKLAPNARAQVAAVAGRIDKLTKDLDAGLVRAGVVAGGGQGAKGGLQMRYDPTADGAESIEVEVDGVVRYVIETDDIVQRFAVEQLGPALEGVDGGDPLMVVKALDRFRFLRAFDRTGRLQWLTGQAKAAWAAGDKGRAAFDTLFATIARGMILSQEPGMIQGPAMLGGVYSQPMALPRFLELLLIMGCRPVDNGAAVLKTNRKEVPVRMGQPLVAAGAGTLQLPRGAVARLDRPGVVDLRGLPEKPFARATMSQAVLAVGQEGVLELQLDASLDPLEYYALIAVPATVGIKQTEDALSDYKGQLIYGQQAMGSGKMQLIAVPFRGSRTLRLLVEGLMPGQATGNAVVRHVHDADRACSVVLPAVRVPSAGVSAPAEVRLP